MNETLLLILIPLAASGAWIASDYASWYAFGWIVIGLFSLLLAVVLGKRE